MGGQTDRVASVMNWSALFALLVPQEDSPHVIFPPLVPATALGLAIVLDLLVPLDFLPPFLAPGWQMWTGLLIFVLGTSLAGWAIYLFYRAHTNVLPTQPALHLVFGGPYRFTRNPMYIAFLFDVTGPSLFLSLEWGLILVPVVWLVVDRFIIPREERYLREKFGAPYEALLTQTRRWI